MKQEDFITGNWYKSTAQANNRGGDTYYGKFLEFRNGGFVASSSRVSGKISDAKYTFGSGYIWEPLTDLSEIQDLLFDNHPDKIKKTTSESITEVFGKFIIGNVVVSLRNNRPFREEGDMFTILPNSKHDCLYYKPSTHSQDAKDWRLATTKEIQAYHNGIKNINQMEEPKQAFVEPSGFLKDEYIVTLGELSGSFPANYVFKQRENADYLRVYKDIRGDTNGNSIADFNNKSVWRYATKQEIMEYDIQDRPVNVTKIGMRPDVHVIPSNAKKWAVRRTEDNYKALNAWANSQPNSGGHSSSGGWIHSINYDYKGHSGSGHYFADDTKHPEHTEITFEQFKKEYMPCDVNNSTTDSKVPKEWYMIVTAENKLDAELWRWDGNPDGYHLEIGQLVGIATHGNKGHNPGSSTASFGKMLTYDEFKMYIFPKEERTRLVSMVYPVGSCVVVTGSWPGMNGKLSYCYKVYGHTGLDNGNVSLKYNPNESIGLKDVRVRKAAFDETDRYIREGKPYDTTVAEEQKYDSITFEPVRPVEPVGRILPKYTDNDEPPLGASDEEILAYCRKKYPIGTVLVGGSVITREVIWESSSFISHPGTSIVYNRRDHTFARILGSTQIEKPSNTVKELPKKATMSDVTSSVKHQEPVIVNSKKAKRSKLVIINK